MSECVIKGIVEMIATMIEKEKPFQNVRITSNRVTGKIKEMYRERERSTESVRCKPFLVNVPHTYSITAIIRTEVFMLSVWMYTAIYQ